MSRRTRVVVVVGLMVHIAIQVAMICNYRVFVPPRTIVPAGDMSGTYRIRDIAQSDASETCQHPFSNAVNAKDFIIRQSATTVEVEEIRRSDKRTQLRHFVEGRDWAWLSTDSAIYVSRDTGMSAPTGLGFARDRIEGQIVKQSNGDLHVLRVYWEYGLMLFLIPFYDERQCTLVYELQQDK